MTNSTNSAPKDHTNRRTFLKRAALGASLAALGGTIAWQNSGYHLDQKITDSLQTLTAKEYLVLAAVTNRILATDKSSAATAEELSVTRWCDGYLSRQPQWARDDFSMLLLALEHSPPLLDFTFTRFSKGTPEQQDSVLEAWASSKLDLRKQGFHALKGLCMLGYYRAPESWRQIGYDGPLVGR